MDNGLIFPYPRKSVQDEAACTNRVVLALSGVGVVRDLEW